MTVHPDYAYWSNALLGTLGPVSDGDPQCGFYRRRLFKDGPFVPVAIWKAEGALVALVDGKTADASEIWTWVCDKPITEAEYHKVMGGGAWSDADPVVDAQVADRRNSDPANEDQVIKDQIEAAKTGADAYKIIESDDLLPKAQSLRSRLLELKGTAEKRHKAEKEPHLKAGRAVDAKWLPTAREAETAANVIRDAMSAWETKKLKARREEERQAEIKRAAEAETARLADEASRPTAAVFAPAPEPAPVDTPAPTAPTPIRGNYGRAASVGVVSVVTGISDQAALYEFMKDHPELKELLLTLAKRAVAKGHTVPGVTVEEQAKVA